MLSLTHWPSGADPETVGRRLAELFSSQPADTSKHYKEACAWYGSLQVAGVLQDQTLVEPLISRYEPFGNSHEKLLGGVGHVDENVFGIVPLEIFLYTRDTRYREEGLSIADHQQTNINRQIRYAIDDMFMITGLQMQAYRATSDKKYANLAASAMGDYLNRLQQADGTFYHHENVLIRWCRGNGWVASGLTELMRDLDPTRPDYAAVRAGYEGMMAGLLCYQVQSGQGAGLWKHEVSYFEGRKHFPIVELRAAA
jgi:rhamnogalacturonyl hydrolase YesR